MTRNLDNKAILKIINDELDHNSTKEMIPVDCNDHFEESSSNISEFNQTKEDIIENITKISLYSRNKNSRIDNFQRAFLEREINMGDQDIATLSAKFRISTSVLYNIKKKR